jgi:anti-anti-sigma factor
MTNSSDTPVERSGKFPDTPGELAMNGPVPWFGVTSDVPGRLWLSGELDLAAVPELLACSSAVEGDLEVDCQALTFIDVAGLRAVLAVHRAAEVRGAKLMLVNPSPCVVRLLGLTGFDKVLAIRLESPIP